MAKIESLAGTKSCRLTKDIITLSVKEAHMLICALSAQIIGQSSPFQTTSTFTVEDENYVPSLVSICVDRNDK